MVSTYVILIFNYSNYIKVKNKYCNKGGHC